MPKELSGTTASLRLSADARGTPLWSMYLDVLPPRGFVTDRSRVKLSFGGGSRRWLSGIRVGPFAADAPAAVGPVAAVVVAGVVLACRRLGIRTPGWAPEAAFGVVADGRAAAAAVAADELSLVVSNAAVERWSPARTTEELLCALVVGAVGVLAPVLDTIHNTHNR